MSRRTRTTALLLVLLLALVVVAPALPFVREAVVSRVVGALSGSGVTVSYRATSGNAWRSVTFHDVEARGLGADVRLDTVTIGYFLPSLLGGELPIDVLVHGATGDVDVRRLLDASVGEASGGAGGPVSLRLRKVDLQDIGVALARVPFSLPDANIGSLSVTRDGTALELGAVISTADGQATVAGRYDALTSVFTGRVAQADATIARHWWDGVTAGNLTGTVAVRGNAIEGDFTVSDGAVADLGLTAANVSGDVTLRYPVITAEVSGDAFGGRVTATGVVNIDAERWEASARGTADMGQAADWLVRSLAPDGMPVPLTGSVAVDLNLVGWEQMSLQGRATGSGALADMPIEALLATFGVAEDGDLTVDAGAVLGGGPVALTIAEDARGARIVATATDVALAGDGNVLGTLTASLDMAAAGSPSGSLVAAWRAELAGRVIDAQVDAGLDPDGWQAFITAHDDLGTSVVGAFVLADGVVDGSLTAADVAGLPVSPSARLGIAAAGPLSAPAITVTLSGNAPVTLAVGPPELMLIDDLRGSVTGTLTGTSVPNLTGAFGPVGVSGTVDLSPIAADLDLTLAETAVTYADTASAVLAIAESELRLEGEVVSWSGTVSTSGLTVGPLVALPGAMAASASFGGSTDGVERPWSVNLTGADGSLAATISAARFALELNDLAVAGTSANQPIAARVSGSVTPPAGAAGFEGQGFDNLALSATVAAGSTIGPTRLVADLALSGEVSLADYYASLAGTTGSLGLDLHAAWGPDVDATLSATVTSGVAEPLNLTLAPASGRFSLTGAADPQALLAALDLLEAGSFSAVAAADLTGTLTGRGLTDLVGGIELNLLEPVALSGRLVGAGSELAVAINGGTAELPLTASGTLDLSDLSDLSRTLGDASEGSAAGTGLTVTLGPLTGIVVTAAGATGSGTYEFAALGPVAIEPIPWDLTADWTDVDKPFATLASGASAFTLTLDAGRLVLSGAASLPIAYAGESLSMSVAVDTVSGSVQVGDIAAVPLRGALEHASTGATLLAFDGTVAGLLVSGDLPTALLAAPLPEQARVDGRLRVDANVDLSAGPDYSAALVLTAAGATLTGTVAGSGPDLHAALSGDGLALTYAGDTLLVAADRASLSPFLGSGDAGSPLSGTVDGSLAHDQAGGWRGTLVAELSWLVSGATADDLQVGASHVAATATMQGRGDSLALLATASGPADSRLSATGTLTPDLALSADLSALDGAVAARLEYGSDTGLAGTVTSTAFEVAGYARLPAQRAEVTWLPGSPLRLVGAGIDLAADPAAGDALLSGTLALPVTLLDGPGRVDAVLGGSLAAPSASLAVVGPGLRAVGSGGLNTANATLTIEEPAFTLLLPDLAAQYAGLLVAPVTADAHWTADEGWTLVANSLVGAAGPADVADTEAAPVEASLDLGLAGSGASYSGGLDLSLGGQSVARVSIAGVGGDLAAELDLEAVQWSVIAQRLGVDIHVVGGGHARFTTVPLDATVDVDMAATVAGLAIAVRGSAPNDLDFTVSGEADAGVAVDLSGRLAWDQEQKAVVTGVIGGQPVDANLRFDDALTTGHLLVAVPGARVVADLTTSSGPGAAAAATEGAVRRNLAITATLDGTGFGGLGGDLSATITNVGGVSTLDLLTADTTTLPGLGDALPLSVTASGVLTPVPEVTGTVSAATLGETAKLSVSGRSAAGTTPGDATGDAAGTTVALSWGELLAVFALDSGRLHVTGAAALGAVAAPFLPEALNGLTADVTGVDLTWSSRTGFGGSFEAAFDAPTLAGAGIGRPLRLRAAAHQGGSGAPTDLDLRLAVTTSSNAALGAVNLRVPADPFSATALDGDIEIATDLAGLLALPELELLLTGSAAILGTLSDPSLAGKLSLAGDVTAAGDFGYAAGAASLDLAGPDLNITANSVGSTWSAYATVDRVPLAAWFSQVSEPYLSLTARADSTGGTRVTVEDLVIESSNSRLTGAATIDTGVRAVLQAQVDLSDLRVAGTEFHGLLRGPVIVTAPTLDSLATANVTAQLDAAGVGIEAVGASVSGSMLLGGNLADPVFNAVLRGNGTLSGGLRLDAAPGRGRLQVHSDLAFGGLDTNLALNIDNGITQARGQLRFGEAALILSDDAGMASFTGAGRLDGWRADISANLAGATVTGPLARLVPGTTGLVDISVGTGAPSETPRAAGEPWLRGIVTGLVVGGQPLGDLRLTSAEAGEPLTLTGPTIRATYAPSSNDWSLDLERQSLPGDLVFDLTGQGNGMTGTITGTARGAGAFPVDAAISLSVAQSVALSVEGQALGGALDLNAHRAGLSSGTWTGTVSLADAEYGGLALRVGGTLHGTDLVPRALLTTATSLAGTDGVAGSSPSITGLISAGLDGITVDQLIDLDAVTDQVRVRGKLTAPTDLVVSATDGSSWRLRGGGANLRASGRLSLDLGPATVTLGATAPSATPTVSLALAATPALMASSRLVGTDLIELIGNVARDGLVFDGAGAARGSVVVTSQPTPQAVLRDFGAEFGGFDIEANGTITADATELTGTLVLPGEVPAVTTSGELRLPWRLVGSGPDWRFDSTGELGTVVADIDAATLVTHIEVDVALPTAVAGAAPRSGSVVERGITSGSVVGRLSYDPAAGATGSFAIADVELAPAALGSVIVNADVAIAGGLITGAAGIDTSGGRVTLTGNAALAELIPGLELAGLESAGGSNLELRIRTLNLGLIPGIADTVPHLNGALSGVVQLRNGVVLGQLVAPELSVGERLMPASLQLSGVPSSIDAALIVAGTLISGELDAGRLTGSARLERFPLELVAEAFVGPSDVTAALTGVLRFDVPLDDAASGFLRIATEEVRLERAGVVTLGNVTITYDDRAVNVERAEFGGRGSWHASGVLSPALLDFRLEAENADFSPLLGLVPDLALYAVGAAGSFTFTASGSFAAPQMNLESAALDIGFAGTRYRIEGTSASLSGVDLTAATTIRGLDPLVGALDFSGGATVMLEPLALRFVDFGFSGSLSVPGFGIVEEISGVIGQDALNNPKIDLSGVLGAPISVSGTLVPLDVRAAGTGLTLSLPALLVGTANLALDLRLRGEEGGLRLGGSVAAEEIILDLSARTPEPEAVDLLGPPGSDSVPDSALTTSERVAATEAQGARNALAALRFDGLRITAPQRVVLAMNIANIEAALDLTVSGTAADPRLDGSAEALRGSLRFSGREFTFDSGVATFSASRGVFPELAIVATTAFEKSRVLSGSQGVRFVSPSEGQTFTVGLAITGPVEPAPPAEGGFRFDVRPVLTSDALIEVEGEGVGTGVRSLTEPELLSLITLGRVDFDTGLVGAGGLGGAVAQGALDTAVDLLIVGELQNALREALGLDVVEIRTSAISSLLDGDSEQFGVSVRLGGYLNPEVFASYRIGTAEPGDPNFALTNEVSLSYALGPLDLDIMGRIDVPTAGTLASPRSELGVGLRYDFGPTLGLDAGVTLSTQRSVVSFGVALRW